MKIAVCEDFEKDRSLLRGYIQAYCRQRCYACEISVFDTAEALLRAFSPGAFDLLFLDIFLPGASGVEAARTIRATDRDLMLVFITESPDFTMEGFAVQAAGYVVKPVSQAKMDQAMHACRFAFDRNSRTIEIPQNGGVVPVSLAELIYVEVYGKNSVLHMKRGEITARMPLDAIEAGLGGSPFLRCHRSYLINMNHVEDMRKDTFLMKNADVVPIRKNGRKEVLMAMAQFIAGEPAEVE